MFVVCIQSSAGKEDKPLPANGRAVLGDALNQAAMRIQSHYRGYVVRKVSDITAD